MVVGSLNEACRPWPPTGAASPPLFSSSSPPEFRVTAKPMSTSRGFLGATLFSSYQTGGCVQLTGLASGVEYELTVQAWSALWNGGDSATVRARAL